MRLYVISRTEEEDSEVFDMLTRILTAAVALVAVAVADATLYPASKVPMWASVAKPTTGAP